MKTLIVLITLVFSVNSLAYVDEYQWCQAQIDIIRKLSVLPLNELASLKKSIAIVASIEELNKITSKDFSPMVIVMQEHQNITQEAAEQATLTIVKGLEIDYISKAISLQGMESEKIWNLQFDKCVKDNLG